MTKKHIFLAQYRLPYPIYWSGADIANLTFLHHLKQRGFYVETLYCTPKNEPINLIKKLLERRGFSPTLREGVLRFEWRSIEIVIVEEAHFFSYYLDRFKQEKVDWVWHHNQFLHCPNLTQFIQTPKGVKHFTYVQSEPALTLLAPLKEHFDLIMSNSNYLTQCIKATWNRDSTVIYPVPELSQYEVNTVDKNPEYITFINPNRDKGADIVYQLIPRFPDKKFLILLGWHGTLPTEWDFSKFDHVTIHPPTQDMKSIYAHTKLLLIPSLWKEMFGRVQIEAAINGVPSIMSNVGALPEIFEGNGTCIDDYLNSDEWENVIREFDNEKYYQNAVENCKKLTKKYSFENEVDKLESLLE